MNKNAILENLFVGSHPEDAHRIATFDLAVFCAAELPPVRSIGADWIRLDDDVFPPSKRAELHDVAFEVARAIRSKRRVIVTCHLGINRSPFVAAAALAHLGIKPKIAIEMLRERRKPLQSKPSVLSNTSFVAYLNSRTFVQDLRAHYSGVAGRPPI